MMKEIPYNGVERRSGKDRRTKRFGNLRWLLKTGQRRQVRRASDRRKIHELDIYPKELLVLVTLVLVLSVVDGILTLWLINNGATEANPVMAYYLRQGPQIFMAAKYLITAAAVVIAVTLSHTVSRIFRVRINQLLKVFAGCFAMVVAWEFFLIAQLSL